MQDCTTYSLACKRDPNVPSTSTPPPLGLFFSRCAYASLRIFAVRLLEELTREPFGCNAAATLWVAAIKD
eukprot:1769090-Prymnesium_polylepis.1